MNPEAVAWLESVTLDERLKLFIPTYQPEFFSLKDDHESCGFCPQALCWGNLLVIE